MLRGLHKVFSPTEVPPVLPAFGPASFKDFVAHGLPHVSSASRIPQQRSNKGWYEDQVRQALQEQAVQPSDIVVFVLDRAPGRTYKPQWKINMVPTLTTQNRYLWLMVAGEVDVPEQQQTLHRFLSMPERFLVQGKDPMIVAVMKSETLSCKASGKAIGMAMLRRRNRKVKKDRRLVKRRPSRKEHWEKWS